MGQLGDTKIHRKIVIWTKGNILQAYDIKTWSKLRLIRDRSHRQDRINMVINLWIPKKGTFWVIPDFRHGPNEIVALPRCYAVLIVRDLYRRFFLLLDFLPIAYGTDRLSRNIGNNLAKYAAPHPSRAKISREILTCWETASAPRRNVSLN
jgi:hypothetical protein